MPAVNIPDDIYRRAEALGLGVEKYLTEALRRVVESMEQDMSAAAKQTEPEPQEVKIGRPPKGAGRERGTWYIERPYQALIESAAKRRGLSRSDVLNEVLAGVNLEQAVLGKRR